MLGKAFGAYQRYNSSVVEILFGIETLGIKSINNS